MKELKDYTDINGIAKILNKSVSTINRYKKHRFIPFHQAVKGAPVLFDIHIVQKWWESLHSLGKQRYK